MKAEPTREISFQQISGWPMLGLTFLLLGLTVGCFIAGGRAGSVAVIVLGIVCFVSFLLTLPGFFIVNPNMSMVLILFGNYRGTVRHNGFFWTNPFTGKRKVSLRARNLNGEKLKVNDQVGNPIEIAAVLVWRVRDTAQALFDVDDYVAYVHIQSETAVRHLASSHPYDAASDDVVSLRRSTEEVAAELKKELEDRLSKAGVEVVEARLTHLAYAPEISGAMLRRQQADAVIAARQKIVDGAVGMVEMALHRLKEANVIELDEERKAAMVSNLLVVLCSEHGTQPVVNTGTLYT
jgi:regulator of protease activity HflC (stomatin/prohibitin superfamily)